MVRSANLGEDKKKKKRYARNKSGSFCRSKGPLTHTHPGNHVWQPPAPVWMTAKEVVCLGS